MIIDPKLFEEIAKRLAQAVPTPVREMQDDLEKNFRAILQSVFHRLDLVTREEFDVQTQVLARTREQLVALEQRVAELEKRAGAAAQDTTAAH